MVELSDSATNFANSTSLTLVSIAAALGAMFAWSQQKPRKDFPPGPRGWPVIGNLLDFRSEKAPHDIFLEYAKIYGDVFSIRAGQRWTVVLNSAQIIKEALLKKGVDFADRPKCISIEIFSQEQDLMFSNYNPTWKLHRKLAFSAFRNLATGNNERFEKIVYSVLPDLTKTLESMGSQPFKPRKAFSTAIINIVATICFGKRYKIDGPELKLWLKYSEEVYEVFGNGTLADYIPLLEYIPSRGVKRVKGVMNEFHGGIKTEVKAHRERYDGGEPKDLIEMLFKAREEMEAEGSEDMSMITEKRIVLTVANVFDAGIGTSVLTMMWSVGLLVQYPEIQAKVAAEVDKVVGRDRLPSLNDRDSLPYTTATLYEIMRYSSIVPMSLPHATSAEVQIGGYTIPKGTWVLFNLHSMHFDEKLWDEPHLFNPEHFLDSTGKVRIHPEGFLPFSSGRRVCIGESIAKGELFLLFSWLFQHFKFAKALGMEGSDYTGSTSTLLGKMVVENDVVVENRF